MVTKEQLLSFMREKAYKPMTYQELEGVFEIQTAEQFKEFAKLLNRLEEEGAIIRTRTNRFGVPERMNLLKGRLQGHAKGFGFLIPDDTALPDVYIHANDFNGAMNGDTILVRVNKGGGGSRMEGEVVRVVKRGNDRVVGTFQDENAYAFVIPDDKRIGKDIFIPKHEFNGAGKGQKVVVQIVKYPEGRMSAEGKVIEVLGDKDEAGVDILSVIRKFGLPEVFPDDVLAEAEQVPDKISDEEIRGRRDLREKKMVTIDGEDAKDLDDAVSIERLDNGNYLLGVHIADVSYYVREGSPLDKEACNRGCSVYLVDRVIPMLPPRLSNGICSLNPQVDRLSMTCEMELTPEAEVVRHEIFTSVIRTNERMTYTNVRKILVDKDPDLIKRYADLVADFKMMEDLAMRLRNRRMQRGAIDFDFEESKIIMNEAGKPVEIRKRERGIAEMMIEEFMLVANETVAEHFHWLNVPFLYRIHEDPDAEKLQHFMEFITNFGYSLKGKANKVHPRSLQQLLEEIKDTPEDPVISKVMLRSMKQAKYDAESRGHFGLAAEFYSHFTSPIRRYPDLVIHRVIREVLENGGSLPDQRRESLRTRMPDIAKLSSERERIAVEAERETDDLKKAEFMLDKIGQEFDGIISGVTSFGFFVELENSIEGLVRVSYLTDDYYLFHEKQLALIGERSAKIFRIGDEVKVRVAKVDVDERTIDFEMVDMKPRKGKPRPAAAAGGGRGKPAGFAKPEKGRQDQGRGEQRNFWKEKRTAAGKDQGQPDYEHGWEGWATQDMNRLGEAKSPNSGDAGKARQANEGGPGKKKWKKVAPAAKKRRK